MNLKIKITLEKKRLLRLRRGGKSRFWCHECGTESDFIAEQDLDDILLKLNQHEKLHKFAAEDGTVLICFESISKEES